MAGFLINSRGTALMVDPLLGGFDMPVMIESENPERIQLLAPGEPFVLHRLRS
ncbi:MAG TPA: hypothetical protein VI094_15365 [Propionibacteriaceae bacterium]